MVLKPNVIIRNIYVFILLLIISSFTLTGCIEKKLPHPVILPLVFTTSTNGNIYPCGCRVPLGGISERGHQINLMRVKHPGLLVLDNGYSLWGVNYLVEKSNGKVIVESMNQMGYRAMNFRTTDLAFYNASELKKLQELAQFDFLSCNIKLKEESINLKKFVIYEVLGVKIAVTGVSEFYERAKDKFEYQKPEYALKEILPDMIKKSDYVIVLSGLDFRGSSNLARMLRGIDLIISAPQVLPVLKPKKVNETIIVTALKDGKSIGFIQVGFNIDRENTDYKFKTINIREGMLKDKKIMTILKKYQLEK